MKRLSRAEKQQPEEKGVSSRVFEAFQALELTPGIEVVTGKADRAADQQNENHLDRYGPAADVAEVKFVEFGEVHLPAPAFAFLSSFFFLRDWVTRSVK